MLMVSDETEIQSLTDLINSVCSRPAMMFDGSFRQGAAFIDGFTSGRGGSIREQLRDFRQWLAIRAYQSAGLGRNWWWSAYITHWYPDDHDAFTQLPILLQQFNQEATAE